MTTKTALEAAATYPNKRLIIHYLPPHASFLEFYVFYGYDGPSYEELITGEVEAPPAELKLAYMRNLRIGLNPVKTMLPQLTGKTVLTSDHGQLLRERPFPIPIRVYDHLGLFTEELLRVPWLELPYETRRKVVADPPKQNRLDAAAAAEQSLETLDICRPQK